MILPLLFVPWKAVSWAYLTLPAGSLLGYQQDLNSRCNLISAKTKQKLIITQKKFKDVVDENIYVDDDLDDQDDQDEDEDNAKRGLMRIGCSCSLM